MNTHRLATAPALSPATTDAALAALAAGGDEQAFELIMRRHNRLMFRSVRSILKTDAEAEEAVQDAWLKAWRALSTFRDDAKLSTWLARVAMNEALQRVRRRSHNVISLDLLMEGGAPQEAGMEADHDEQPDERAGRAEVRRLMEARIDALPEIFRTVFVLRAVQEMSVEEVAAALQVPDATVRTRFFRARAMLRECLSRDIDFALEDAFSFDGERCDRIVAAVMAAITSGSRPGPASI